MSRSIANPASSHTVMRDDELVDKPQLMNNSDDDAQQRSVSCVSFDSVCNLIVHAVQAH